MNVIPATAATEVKVISEFNRIVVEGHLAPGPPATLVDRTAGFTQALAAALRSGVVDDRDERSLVRVLVETEGKDRLGTFTRDLSLFAVDFVADDLRKGPQASVPAQLNLAIRVVFSTQAGAAAADAWCAVEANRGAAPKFCGLVQTADRVTA